jgi:hypothetical protein
MLIKIQVSWDMKTSIWNTLTMKHGQLLDTWHGIITQMTQIS